MTENEGDLYKLLIIGGGPAGVGVFVRAARTGFLARLMNPVLHGEAKDVEVSERLGMKQKGVAIVHDDDASTFGSGTLGKYLINSNTFARSLLSSILDEKPDIDPPESIKGTFLERAKEHETTKKLEEIGNAPACLIDFGSFLQNVGACVLKDLPETSKCLLNTRATRFNRLDSGIYRVEVSENERVSTLFAEYVVFATGGQQALPPQLEENAAYKAKSFLSEDCLRDDGFTRLRNHLLQSEDRKVCIVGGSHSSFSVAWLLLNKGKTQRTKSVTLSNTVTSTGAEDPANASDSIDVSSPPDKSDAPRSPMATADAVPSPPSVSKAMAQPLMFHPRDITIIHRSPIRCYYATRKEAEADGADGSRVDRTGCVNTFTGLREDAKNLFKDVKSGKESRVRLFQVNPQGSQNLTTKAYDSASAIVWSCGYASHMLPGTDEQGKPIKYHEDHGVVKLDMQGRVQVVKAPKTIVPATNLYGVGIGFSLRAHVDEMGTETRADGVTVYHRRGAALVLAALFGSTVFGKDTTSFEDMVEKNDKNRKKKERSDNATESSLVDSIKRSATSSPSTSSPLVSPGKSSSTTIVTEGASLVPAIVASTSPEKTVLRRISGKTPSHTLASHPPVAAPVLSLSATNPPVKMLLQRRRSAETREPPGSVPRKPSARVAPAAGPASLSKTATLQGRSAPFAERRREAQDAAVTPVA